MTSDGQIVDVRERPAYTVAEAARYLRMPAATLKSWIACRNYPSTDGNRQTLPLITLHDKKGQYLSFINLVEAHVLKAMRRQHGVRMPKVRSALRFVRKQFNVERPLVDQSFQTNGLDLFVEHYGQLINVSREGQQGMREAIGRYLERIERDESGSPIRLFPFVRPEPQPDAPKLVVISPAVSFGQPTIVGTGVTTEAIYERYAAGDSVEELSDAFGVPENAVEEAIRCAHAA